MVARKSLDKYLLARVRDIARAINFRVVVTNSSYSVRGPPDSIDDSLTMSYVGEAIACFEAKQLRAGVVLSWAGAVALLHKQVFTAKRAGFHTEAARRESRYASQCSRMILAG